MKHNISHTESVVRIRSFKQISIFTAIVDMLLLNLSFLLALCLRFGIDIFRTNRYLTTPQIALFFVFSLFCILIFRSNNLYRISIFLDATAQFLIILRSMLYGIIVLVVLSFLLKSSDIFESRLVLGYYGIIGVGLVWFTRIALLRSLFHCLVTRGIFRTDVIILSNGITGQALGRSLSTDETFGVHLVGSVKLSDDGDPIDIPDLPVLGSVDALSGIVEKNGVDEIYAIIDNVSYEELVDVVNRCKTASPIVKLTAPQCSAILNVFFADRYCGVPVITMKGRRSGSWYAVGKRVVDLVGAAVALILLVPLLSVIALAIRLSSSGPVLFRQTRIGKQGKPFTFFKFRSMKVGSDDTIHREYLKRLMKNEIADKVKKIADDPRVTRIGRFIRRTSIDELPQLFNVLKGEMSLVGPRPCLPFEWEMYEPWHRGRLSVIPGCTGAWQVGGRSKVSFNDMVMMDLYYIGNASLWLDLQLILKTIPILLLRKGGY